MRARCDTRRERAAGLRALIAVLFASALVFGHALPALGLASRAPAAAPAEGVSTAEEYRTRLQAVLDLAHLASDDDLTEGDAAELSHGMREFLPPTERVRSGATVVTVDNSVLDSLISRLAAADSVTARRDLLETITAHLESLSVAQGTEGRVVPEDPAALETLLADRAGTQRSSLEGLFGDLVDRLGAALLKWWTSVSGSAGAGRALTITTIVLIVALVAVLLWVAVRAYLRARAGTASRAKRIPGEGDDTTAPVAAAEGLPADPLAYADELAAAGDHRAALRALFGGAARLLVEAGLVRQTHTMTNGELEDEIGGRAPLVRAPLASLRARFEAAWYGHRDPAPEQVADARVEYVTLRERALAPAATDESDESGGDAA